MLGSLTPTTSSDDPINDILSRYDLFISKPKEKDAWLLLVFFLFIFYDFFFVAGLRANGGKRLPYSMAGTKNPLKSQ